MVLLVEGILADHEGPYEATVPSLVIASPVVLLALALWWLVRRNRMPNRLPELLALAAVAMAVVALVAAVWPGQNASYYGPYCSALPYHWDPEDRYGSCGGLIPVQIWVMRSALLIWLGLLVAALIAFVKGSPACDGDQR